MAVDTTSQKFRDIIADINANTTDVASAVDILSSTKYDVVDPQDIATYLAYSKLAPVSTTNPDGTPKTAKQPVSITTVLGIPTGIASMLGMMGKPAALAGIMPKIGTGFLAGLMQYEVFDRAEKATEEAKTANIAMLGALYFGAIAATMLWLSKMNSYHVTNANTIGYQLGLTLEKWAGKFTLDYNQLPQFLMTLAVAGAITTLVVLAGVLIAKLGQDQAPATPQASVVNSFLKQIPKWSDRLPANALAAIMAGAAVTGSSFSLTPGNMSSQFHTPTVQLVQELGGTTQDGASMLGKVLVTTDPNGGPDVVSLVYPGGDGYGNGISFALDTNGYIIGNKGPATNYLPFFQPIVDASGKVTGIKKNYGALNAILQIPACTAIANGPGDARQREAALETCLRNNKDVQFIAMVGS